MQWILAFHIIFVISWFAGLFYLPRLFVYHVDATDEISNARFKVMERKLFNYIMTPAAILATVFGLLLLASNWSYYMQQGWMHVKLLCVVLLWAYHIWCGKLVTRFRSDNNQHSSKFFRYFNEIPTVLLFIIVIMVVVQPH